jgi:hypothetical protein
MCEGFQEGTFLDPFSGFTGVGVTLTIESPGANGSSKHLHAVEQAGQSYISASGHFEGSYAGIGTCYDLSFDVRLFDDADPNASASWRPYVRFGNGTLSATFQVFANQAITEDGGSNPGWHHFAVPLGPLQNGLMPTSPQGAWSIDDVDSWATLLENVADVWLNVEVGAQNGEEIGYDNICIRRVCDVASYFFDDTSNIGFDSPSNLHQGTLGAATVVPAPCGNALRFGPDNNVHEFTVRDSDDLDLVGAMTGMAMIRPLGTHSADNNPGCSEGTIFSKGGNYWFQISKNNKQLVFQNVGGGDMAVANIQSCIGQWMHVTFVREADGRTVRFYRNGKPIGTPTTLSTLGIANDDPLMVGNHGFGNDPGACEFNGDIDEIRIFNRALSDAEVADEFLNSCPVPPWPWNCYVYPADDDYPIHYQ